MANVIWRGDAVKTAQVDSVTPANVNIGNTFTCTINGKSITVTATAGTVANVTGLLYTACAASTIPEFAEITWADMTTYLKATAKTAGKPFTLTASATGGTATNTRAAVTANSGPNDASLAANWDRAGSASLPQAADDVFIQQGSASLLYGLEALSAVTVASLLIDCDTFSGSIGLPIINSDSSSGLYYEYRPQYFKLGITALNVRGSAGSQRLKIDGSSVQTTLNILGTGRSPDSQSALLWKGTHASNVVNVQGGSVGIAELPGEVATIATLRVTGDAAVFCGSGCTLTTLNQNGSGSSLIVNSAATTLTKSDGTTELRGSGAYTTIETTGGTLTYKSTGTITSLYAGDGATVDFTADIRSRTVTTGYLYAGCTVLDDFRTVTWTNPIQVLKCGLEDITLRLGQDISLVPASI